MKNTRGASRRGGPSVAMASPRPPAPSESSVVVTQAQRRFLQLVFDHFHATGDWPVLSQMQHQLELEGDFFDLAEAARDLDPSLGQGDISRDGASLTVRAFPYCEGADEEKADFALVVRLFYEAYRESGKQGRVRSADLLANLNIGELRVRKLGRLLETAWLLRGGGRSGEVDWELDVSLEVTKFRDVRTFEDYLRVEDALMPRRVPFAPPVPVPSTELSAGQMGGYGETASMAATSLDGLHPSIITATHALFADGHYSSAVAEAFKVVEGAVRAKSGLESFGTTLMGEAFSDTNPRLRLRGRRGTDAKSEQAALRFLLMGAMLGIRNPVAHGLGSGGDRQLAHESLAFASLLIRRVDAAYRVRRAASPSPGKRLEGPDLL